MPSSHEKLRSRVQLPKELTSDELSVNDSPALGRALGGAAPGASIHRFTPWREEAAMVSDPRRLAVSANARTLLGIALWRAGPLGQGEGCGPSEAMFLRRLTGGRPGESLLADTRMTKWAVQRAIRELTAAGLLRSRLVYALERVPRLPHGGGGGRAEQRVMVFYVAIARLRELLGIGAPLARKAVSQPGTPGARKAVSQPFKRLCPEPSDPCFSREIATRLTKIGTVNPTGGAVVKRDPLTTNHSDRREPARSVDEEELSERPTRGGGWLESPDPRREPRHEREADDLVALWWQEIGAKRMRAETLPPRRGREIRSAILRALRDDYPASDLALVIRARAHPEIGGKAYWFCEEPPAHPDRPYWGATIFDSGSIDYLRSSGRLYEKRQRAAEKAPRTRDRDPAVTSVPRTEAVEQKVAQELTSLGIAVRPAWLDQRPQEQGSVAGRVRPRP